MEDAIAGSRPQEPMPLARWLASDPWWALAVITVVPCLRAAYRWRLIGVGNLPASGPVLLASNHISPLDPFAVGLAGVARRRAVRYLTSAEFFDWPVGGFLLRRIRMVPIRRGAADRAALDAAVRALREGEVLGIFPEGRIGDGGALQRGRSGVARLALRTGLPVVPVGVWGPQRRWSGSGLSLRPPLRPRAAIAVGEAIPPEGAAGGDAEGTEAVGRLRDTIMSAIEVQVNAAREAAGGATG
jgi:1-acyl-sn-glycerol-3-phosphate acyltransferase